MNWGSRSVAVPLKTPPATVLGALLSGRPSGSTTASMPGARNPPGMLVNQGRPNALLIEIAVGRATGGSAAVTARGL